MVWYTRITCTLLLHVATVGVEVNYVERLQVLLYRVYRVVLTVQYSVVYGKQLRGSEEVASRGEQKSYNSLTIGDAAVGPRAFRKGFSALILVRTNSPIEIHSYCRLRGKLKIIPRKKKRLSRLSTLFFPTAPFSIMLP